MCVEDVGTAKCVLSLCCCASQGILAANGDSPLEGDPDEWDKLFKVRVAGCSRPLSTQHALPYVLRDVMEC